MTLFFIFKNFKNINMFFKSFLENPTGDFATHTDTQNNRPIFPKALTLNLENINLFLNELS